MNMDRTLDEAKKLNGKIVHRNKKQKKIADEITKILSDNECSYAEFRDITMHITDKFMESAITKFQ